MMQKLFLEWACLEQNRTEQNRTEQNRTEQNLPWATLLVFDCQFGSKLGYSHGG
jgi:hypothetical protein